MQNSGGIDPRDLGEDPTSGLPGPDLGSTASVGRGARLEGARAASEAEQSRWREAGNDYWTAGGPGPKVMAADTLTGDDVYNDADEKLGEISDIMIDVPTGRVAYAVMAVGGVLGLGSKLLAIPWSALRLDSDKKCFRLDATLERVENAPGFDKDHWPSMADQQWAEDIHAQYGTRPYWA
jgi:sporulation protein YlmC with PRC-barrel domain